MDEWDLALALCDVPDEFVMEAAEGGIRKKAAWRYRSALAAAAVLFVLLVGSRIFFVQGGASYKITNIKIENPWQPINDNLITEQFYEYPQFIVVDGGKCYQARGAINAEGAWKGVLLEFEGKQTLIHLETASDDAVKIDDIVDEMELKNKVYKIGDFLGFCQVVRTEHARKTVLFRCFQVDVEISRKESLQLYACESADGADVVAIKVEDSKLGELYYLYEKTEKEE